MHYRFIINPTAGRGRSREWVPWIVDRFRRAGASFDLFHTGGAGDATAIARQAAAEGVEAVVAVGGDGTVNEAVNGLAHSSTALASLPAGRGNDFSRLLGFPTAPAEALEDLLAARPGRLDLGRVTDRYFVNIVGVGFDAAVADAAQRLAPRWVRGTWAYLWGLFRVLRSFRPLSTRIFADGEPVFANHPLLVAVGIGSHYGGGMAILPGAEPDDGLFDVVLIQEVSLPVLLYHLPKVYRGTHVSLPQAKTFHCRELSVELDQRGPLHMDGEALWARQLDFSLWPGGLPVLLGRHARWGSGTDPVKA